MPPVAALAGGLVPGAAALDYKSAKKAQKAQKKGKAQTIDTFYDALDRTRELGAKGQNYRMKIPGLFDASTNKALKLSAGLGTSASQSVLDREQALLGASDQNLVGRGLYDSSVRRSQARPISSDATKHLLDINEATNGLSANIIQQGAGQKAGAYSQIAGGYDSQSAQEAALYEALASYLGGIQYSAGPSALGGLAGIAKLLASAGAGGGGAGAGAGGQAGFAGSGGIF